MTNEALLDQSYDFYTRGDNKRAIQILEQIIARTPRSARARYGIGLILTEEEKFEKAIPQLEFAHELSPQSADVLIQLGYALSSNKNHSQALAALAEAQSLEPDNSEVGKAIENCQKRITLNDLSRTTSH